jgi:hypothetical protein
MTSKEFLTAPRRPIKITKTFGGWKIGQTGMVTYSTAQILVEALQVAQYLPIDPTTKRK